MQIRLTSSTRVNGTHYEAGHVLDVSEGDGLELLAAQRGEHLAEPEAENDGDGQGEEK